MWAKEVLRDTLRQLTAIKGLSTALLALESFLLWDTSLYVGLESPE